MGQVTVKTNTETDLRAAQHVWIRASTKLSLREVTESPAKAGVKRERSNSRGAAAVPELLTCTAAGTGARCHQRGLRGSQRR